MCEAARTGLVSVRRPEALCEVAGTSDPILAPGPPMFAKAVPSGGGGAALPATSEEANILGNSLGLCWYAEKWFLSQTPSPIKCPRPPRR